MTDSVLGEIIMVGFDFPPQGYALCNGQTLSIAQYPDLFKVLGNTYGGDGQTTFALPDLRGRVPVSASATIARGHQDGAESHLLDGLELPEHSHPMLASSDAANTLNPANSLIAPTTLDGGKIFSAESARPDAVLGPQSIGSTGGGEAHNNMQPSLVINFCIATTGTLPPNTPPQNSEES